jgi:hypothetical protein
MMDKSGRCIRCGQVIPENGIHLFRGGDHRVIAVKMVFPDSDVSLCGNPPPDSYWNSSA